MKAYRLSLFRDISLVSTRAPHLAQRVLTIPLHALPFVLLAVLLSGEHSAIAAQPDPEPSLAADSRWSRSPWQDAHYFPLAVWLQNPSRAEEYKKAGINTYVGLWRGPTEEQLDQLQKAGMKLICSQNRLARTRLEDRTIIAWMHGDEPDNAQSLGTGKGYGPPIAPSKIIEDYESLRKNDPSRPVLLNLGQGVAWDNWIGRGVRRNHPEDYPEYVKGCDIASFDIYPAVHDHPEVAGKLWFVPQGVERLKQWAGPSRKIWNCLECTRISNTERKPTPAEVRAEAWMALIHGSQGLIYFVHQFKPTFNEAALLADQEMLTAVTELNRQITELAPVLNSTSIEERVRVTVQNSEIPVATMTKRYRGGFYLFAVPMREGVNQATFELPIQNAKAKVTVLYENRTLELVSGKFQDEFRPWEVHLYRITHEN